MRQILQWRLKPTTPITWLELFMQVLSSQSADARFFHIKRFVPREYCSITQVGASVEAPDNDLRQLLDLCILDVDSLRFSDSMLAAAALVFKGGVPIHDIEQCTGLRPTDVVLLMGRQGTCRPSSRRACIG